ncbi:MAG TPA: putative toxin-antitoxin system toxin component, PIN family [Spirochaetota bacterium]|nr:putative toxin-antitoxin system toxin component, PIN family [Spirochaetota bacterium]HPI90495.1 putative toxin-antitoxin system toxin component, PIN family [Spirochaetota bacterium]HPR46939.1 putative toxin-antitoxin system toxin component, PIN family [Spirochaetota bacterium]
MKRLKIVLDSNVIFSGLLSKKGASFGLLKIIPENKFTIVISVPLIIEYESVLIKNLTKLHLNRSDINDFLDYLCAAGEHAKIFYLWRPLLKDPYDDHVLEVAVSSNSQYIITYNIKDFKEAQLFGIHVITPDVFLSEIVA